MINTAIYTLVVMGISLTGSLVARADAIEDCSPCPFEKDIVCIQNPINETVDSINLTICWESAKFDNPDTYIGVRYSYNNSQGNRQPKVKIDELKIGYSRIHYNSTIDKLCKGRSYLIEVYNGEKVLFEETVNTSLSQRVLLPAPELKNVTQLNETDDKNGLRFSFELMFNSVDINSSTECNKPLFLFAKPDIGEIVEIVLPEPEWNITYEMVSGNVTFSNDVSTFRVYYEAKNGQISEMSNSVALHPPTLPSITTIHSTENVEAVVIASATIVLLISLVLAGVIATICAVKLLKEKRTAKMVLNIGPDDIVSIPPDVITICEDQDICNRKHSSQPSTIYPTSLSGFYITVDGSQPRSEFPYVTYNSEPTAHNYVP